MEANLIVGYIGVIITTGVILRFIVKMSGMSLKNLFKRVVK